MADEKAKNSAAGWIVAGVALVAFIYLVGTHDDRAAPDNDAARASSPLAGGAVPRTWVYATETDAMMDNPGKRACVTSDNEVTQSFPYETTTAQLCVRQHPKFGLDVYLQLDSKGQILCRSYSGCPIRIRYDKGAVRTVQGNEASDNSSEIVFFRSARSMVANLKKTNKTIIEITLYQNGAQNLIFNTKGLKWS